MEDNVVKQTHLIGQIAKQYQEELDQNRMERRTVRYENARVVTVWCLGSADECLKVCDDGLCADISTVSL